MRDRLNINEYFKIINLGSAQPTTFYLLNLLGHCWRHFPDMKILKSACISAHFSYLIAFKIWYQKKIQTLKTSILF